VPYFAGTYGSGRTHKFLITDIFCRVSMSAPPGIEIIFVLIVGFFVLVSIAIGAGFAAVIRRVFKIRLGLSGKVGVAVLFFLLFTVSSLPVRAIGERTTVYIGFRDPYDVVWLYYGFPAIWAYKFEPFDQSAAYLFRTPSIYNFLSLSVDITFWLVISVFVVYCVKFYFSRRHATHVPARPTI